MYSTYIACSTGLEKGNVHNTLCTTVMHCAHIKLLCVSIYRNWTGEKEQNMHSTMQHLCVLPYVHV